MHACRARRRRSASSGSAGRCPTGGSGTGVMTRPTRAAWSTRSRASAAVSANGLSTTTCSPRSSASCASGAWVAVGVVIVTPVDAEVGQLGERRPTGVAPGRSARTWSCRSGEPVTTATSSNPVAERDQRLMEGPAAGAIPSQRPAKRCALVGGHPAILSSAARSAQNVGLSDPTPSMGTVIDHLIVRGAREHNLRNVDISLPRDSLVVFTGLSGSGKSSLAFDTIFAEGQRRYVESLSSYARQFLGQMDKPDVDFIEGLSPAVSIDQKSTSRNPRSTVGTITEIYDYLRLLYARIGHPHCPICGEPISKQTPQQIVDRVLEMPEGTRFQVLAPVIRERKGEYVDLFADLQAKGYSRARIDGVVYQLTEPPKLKKQEKHSIEVVVDRLVNRPTAKQRITDSVETGLRPGRRGGHPGVRRPGRGRPAAASGATPSGWPARTTTRWRSTSWSRGRSPSTRRSAPARSAPAWAPARRSTPSWSCRTAPRPWAAARSSPGPAGTTSEYFIRLLQGLAEVHGLLHGHPVGPAAGGTPARRCCTASTSRCTSPTATGTTGSGRTTPSSRASSRSWSAGPRRPTRTSPGRSTRATCGRCRARSATAPGSSRRSSPSPSSTRELGRQNIAELSALSIKDAAAFFPGLVLSERDRMIAERVLKEVDARLGLPARRRSGLPVAGPAGRHPVRRRGAADPAGHPDRLRAGRRAVRAGRAVDRAAPAGQSPADPDPDPAARSGQHADRRRARRGHHPHRRLGGGHRARARASTAARWWCPARSQELERSDRVDHRRVPVRPAGDRGAAGAAPGRPHAQADRGRRPGEQPARHHRRLPARHPHRGDRGVRVRASRRWSTTSCTRCWRTGSTAPGWCPAGTPG